jgi:hydrogenase maturation protease
MIPPFGLPVLRFDPLRMPAKQQILIIGLGNDYRRDDAAGLVTVRKLAMLVNGGMRIVEASGEGTALIEAWKGVDFVILVDAVHSCGSPGSIHRFDPHLQPIPVRFFHYSTHAFSVAEAVELARTLGQLPPKLILYGIEGKEFESGIGLSTEVEQATEEVVRKIQEELCTNFR